MNFFASLRPVGLLLVAVFSLFFLAPLAAAEERSELEQSVIEEALSKKGWELEPLPEGKTVEEIGIYVLDVFDARDPVPRFVNIFHANSRDWVIAQEVLVDVGDPWERGRILETERNLRKLRQLSVANVVAAKGSRPDRVKLLVVVKDVWSLRLNSEWGTGRNFDRLLINPAEENFGGLHLSAGLLYLLDRDRHAFGARVVYPRLAGSRYHLGIESSFSTNRETGKVEGSSGVFVFQLPLYSRHRHFSYGAEAAWNLSIVRRYVEGGYRMYDYEHSDGRVESIPETYHVEGLGAEYFALHSLGVTHKRDLSYGVEVNHRRYEPEDLSEYSGEAQEAFARDVIPVSDRRLSPFFQLRLYRTKFHRVLNLELLSLQEDYRTGYDVLLRIYGAGQALGSSRDLIGTLAGLGVTLPFGDGLVRAQVTNDIVIANDAQNEGLFALAGRVAFPSVMVGRLHVDGRLAIRYENYLNVGPFLLRDSNRLRGYEFGSLGEDYGAVNFEFRTVPVDILSAQVGLASFLDVAGAASSVSEIRPLAGVGLGLRMLFPQLDRSVLRFDWGFPVSPGYSFFPGTFYFTFGQAFSIPSLSAPSMISSLSPF